MASQTSGQLADVLDELREKATWREFDPATRGLFEEAATLLERLSSSEVTENGSYFSAIEDVMHFINALDSGDMDGRQVRSAIYAYCLEARPPRSAATSERKG